MSLRKKQSEFARMLARLIDRAEELGFEATLGDAYRDPRIGEILPFVEQFMDALYDGSLLDNLELQDDFAKRWESLRRPLFRYAAPPYRRIPSEHRRRLAIDINLFRNGDYLTETENHRQLGEFWESIGGKWGGRFNDGNHYEWPL